LTKSTVFTEAYKYSIVLQS